MATCTQVVVRLITWIGTLYQRQLSLRPWNVMYQLMLHGAAKRLVSNSQFVSVILVLYVKQSYHIATGKSPDAVNLWIGDSKSITSIHSGLSKFYHKFNKLFILLDPYENIYTVVRGVKHFTLLPPTEGWCLKGASCHVLSLFLVLFTRFFTERMYPHAVYKRSPASNLVLEPSPSRSNIRWSSILEPHIPGNLPPDAHPIHITLKRGDTLYLPAGWWHQVRQSGGVTVALNWWYDIEMCGMTWVLLSFLRGIEDVPSGDEDQREIYRSWCDLANLGHIYVSYQIIIILSYLWPITPICHRNLTNKHCSHRYICLSSSSRENGQGKVREEG